MGVGGLGNEWGLGVGGWGVEGAADGCVDWRVCGAAGAV